jgi:hypothetical protein
MKAVEERHVKSVVAAPKEAKSNRLRNNNWSHPIVYIYIYI